MRYVGYITFLVVGIVIGVSITLSITSPRPPSTVQINIENKSGMSVSNIVVRHEDGSASINFLQKSDNQALPVLVFGESSYTIEATLENGTVVAGQAGYVEPGYVLTETITKSGIKNELFSLP